MTGRLTRMRSMKSEERMGTEGGSTHRNEKQNRRPLLKRDLQMDVQGSDEHRNEFIVEESFPK